MTQSGPRDFSGLLRPDEGFSDAAAGQALAGLAASTSAPAGVGAAAGLGQPAQEALDAQQAAVARAPSASAAPAPFIDRLEPSAPQAARALLDSVAAPAVTATPPPAAAPARESLRRPLLPGRGQSALVIDPVSRLDAMYTTHFGLQREPFSIAPDPRYLYMSERHREALAHLLYGIQGGGGFVVLTGEIGAGKTTVCRCFLEQIPANCRVAYIFNPRLDAQELVEAICDDFGVPAAGAGGVAGAGVAARSLKHRVDALNGFLLQAHARGERCLVIIDEAQSLSVDVLEQLRLLTNLETSEHKLLQIVLIGQPELRTVLERPDLEQLAQRIVARYHLRSLTVGEADRYIQHRWAVAGGRDAPPFAADVLLRIHELTRGIPRRINLLCDRALLGAYSQGQRQVDLPTLEQAAREVFGEVVALERRAADRQRAELKRLLLAAAIGLSVGAMLVLLWLWAERRLPWMQASPTSSLRMDSAPLAPPRAPAGLPQVVSPPAVNPSLGAPQPTGAAGPGDAAPPLRLEGTPAASPTLAVPATAPAAPPAASGG